MGAGINLVLEITDSSMSIISKFRHKKRFHEGLENDKYLLRAVETMEKGGFRVILAQELTMEEIGEIKEYDNLSAAPSGYLNLRVLPKQ
jgi:hypothetical protein